MRYSWLGLGLWLALFAQAGFAAVASSPKEPFTYLNESCSISDHHHELASQVAGLPTPHLLPLATLVPDAAHFFEKKKKGMYTVYLRISDFILSGDLARKPLPATCGDQSITLTPF